MPLFSWILLRNEGENRPAVCIGMDEGYHLLDLVEAIPLDEEKVPVARWTVLKTIADSLTARKLQQKFRERRPVRRMFHTFGAHFRFILEPDRFFPSFLIKKSRKRGQFLHFLLLKFAEKEGKTDLTHL